MVEIDISYNGQLRCNAVHGPSRTQILTDAPTDNMGKGEAFSPTDLLATSLATCMLTVMGIVAQRIGADLTGTKVHVTKEMVTDPKRRIGRIGITMRIPATNTPEQRERLESAARHCPVHPRLSPDVNVALEFQWVGT